MTNHRYMGWFIVTAALILSACGGGSDEDKVKPQTDGAKLHYVEFGDSWPEGAHCNGCKTFADLYGVELKELSGKSVAVTDLLGSKEPGLGAGQPEATATLLESMRSNKTTRAAVKEADVILIAAGPNELDQALSASVNGTCGGSDSSDCIEALGRLWSTNFGAILDEIDVLRDGQPTAIRLVSAANPFVSDEAMSEGLPEGFATTKGARIFELLTKAMCDAADEHGAVCVDVRPILNGPDLTTPVDENSDASMRAVADALVATGLPELK